MSDYLRRAREGQPSGIEIIDMHGHIGRYSFAIPELAPATIVESMDKLGIVSILCSSMCV